MKPTQTANGR